MKPLNIYAQNLPATAAATALLHSHWMSWRHKGSRDSSTQTGNVRFRSKADIAVDQQNVPFTPQKRTFVGMSAMHRS
jgi:hypothetical protein